MKLIIYTDGGSRGNPGPAAIGGVIMNRDKKVIEKVKRYLGEATNNQAEYTAMKETLEHALQYNPTEIDCFLDSELVVNQMNGIYKIKDPELKKIHNQIQDLIFMRIVRFTHVPREQNKLADKLVNEALDEALWSSAS